MMACYAQNDIVVDGVNLLHVVEPSRVVGIVVGLSGLDESFINVANDTF